MSGLKDNPVAGGMQIAGTVMSAYGQYQQGQAIEASSERSAAFAAYKAMQERQNATQEIAASQRSAEEDRLRTQYAVSRAVAVAAAGGGAASDPGVVNIVANIERQGAYNASVDLYQGKSAARSMENQANADIYGASLKTADAKQAASAKTMGAVTTLMKGGASIYDKYAKIGPGAS